MDIKQEDEDIPCSPVEQNMDVTKNSQYSAGNIFYKSNKKYINQEFMTVLSIR